MTLTKRPVDYGPEELRVIANERNRESKQEARAELERRRDNLRNAVIPAWEREARGADPRNWKLW